MQASRAVGAAVRLLNLSKAYGDVHVVDAITLEVSAGELMTLLGPSGCGKTTTLMMIAGFTQPTAGDILIDNTSLSGLPPHRRNVGVVFQHYALFPHMTVTENVAFPLRMRGGSRSEVAERARWVLDLVKMSSHSHHLPEQLSGGQQQRVAVARAIVFDPPVLLLDEPLSALDKQLRNEMQSEIKALHARLGMTMICVTHDQTEALALSDRVALMNEGRLVQVGTPQQLYEKPASQFVANFVGESSVFTGRVERDSHGACAIVTQGNLRIQAHATDLKSGTEVQVLVRPERVLLGADAIAAGTILTGEVKDVSYSGDTISYRIALTPAEYITARVQNRGHRSVSVTIGSSIRIGWRPEDQLIFATGAVAGKQR